MKEAIKVFGKDYIDLMKHSLKFTKDHWVELAVTSAAIFAVEAGALYLWSKKIDAELEREAPFMDLEKVDDTEKEES